MGVDDSTEIMWHAQFGALRVDGGVRFRTVAPEGTDLRLVLQGGPMSGDYEMVEVGGGIFDLLIPDVGAGQRYGYRLGGSDLLPDPASRFQPDGVHGPSEVVDPGAFAWHDRGWRGVPAHGLVIYELHIGTFAPDGTFASVRDRLEALRDLGVTAIEIMPVADFAGSRNWGYDGASPYAPSRAYGRPDALRALVDRAHHLGLAVILDVVYNHLGPEGAYLPRFLPRYLTDRHETPWGRAVNLDGPGSDLVRRFITDNAVHWIREYHLDGLRLDATHALIDSSPLPFMQEFARHVRGSVDRPIVLHAEDHRNLDEIINHDSPRAWGFDGEWADDFHHVVRRLVAGDAHGYYEDYMGTTEELARTIAQGWLFTGEHSRHLGMMRGTDPSSIPMYRFIVCVQNHDQVGNRAFGDRLHQRVDAATWRAISALLLMVPMTPLLFMGQEWAASAPFQYFTDLEPELGKLVTAGRRGEFRHFPEFARPDASERIPDPQSPATFERSRLGWDERDEPDHARVLALYRALLDLRRGEPALGASHALAGEAFPPDEDSLVMKRTAGDAEYLVFARLRGSGRIDAGAGLSTGAGGWEVRLTTEEPRFSADPRPPRIETAGGRPVVCFDRPGAAILRARP